MKQKIITIDLGGVNSYLLQSEQGFLLIDTGGPLLMDKGFSNRRDLLESELQKAGCNKTNIELIVLTHGDADHVFNAAYLKDKYHTKIAIHREDAYLVISPTQKDFLDSLNYDSFLFNIITKIMHKTFQKIAVKTIAEFHTFTPDLLIDESFNLRDYGFEGEIIHLPGHTKGSIGILLDNHNFIAGDIFSNHKKPAPAMNALDFQIMRESIERLKQLAINTVYVGHGSPFVYGK